MNVHGHIASLLKSLRPRLYQKQEVAQTHRYLDRLRILVSQLPEDDESIIGAEAYAICYELGGRIDQAIKWRIREIELIHMLHDDIKLHNYDERTRIALLEGRDEESLDTRIAIIEQLRKKLGGQ